MIVKKMMIKHLLFCLVSACVLLQQVSHGQGDDITNLNFITDTVDEIAVNLILNNSPRLSSRSRSILRKMDRWTVLVSTLTGPSVMQAEPTDDGDVTVTDVGGVCWKRGSSGAYDDWKKKYSKPGRFDISDDVNIRILSEDEYLGEFDNILANARITDKNAWPIEDIIEWFKDQEEADFLMNELKLAPGQANSELTNNWADAAKTDRYFEDFFFRGIGAVTLHYQAVSNNEDDVGSIAIDLPMHEFEVRKGFRPYGVKIYFTNDQKVSAIYDYHEENLVRPGDDKWGVAMFLAKSSAITMITLQDHLIWTHLIISNYMTLFMLKRLPPSHPIRRLLTIFTYGTNEINNSALSSLTPEGSFLHRGSAFTYDSLRKFFDKAYKDCPLFQPFPEQKLIPELQKLSDEGKLPFHSQGSEYFGIIRKFVQAWVDLAGDTASDEYTLAFYAGLLRVNVGQKYELPEFSKEALVDTITQMIFVVTAYHEIIGTVIDYIKDHESLSLRVVSGASSADVQSFLIGSVVGAVTSFDVPQLVSPFLNYFGQGGAPSWERRLWDNFQADLVALSQKVEAANEIASNVNFKLFNPEIFESSVSF